MGLCHIKSRHLISSCVLHLSWWTRSLRKPAEHEELTLRALCQSCGKDRSGSCRRTKTPKGRATPFSSGEENLAEEMVPPSPIPWMVVEHPAFLHRQSGAAGCCLPHCEEDSS